MKVIYRIAKTELSLMFYSPIAWLVLIIFIIQSGYLFSALLVVVLQDQNIFGISRAIFKGGLTNSVFEGVFGFYNYMQQWLYLYMPMLTMGLISREINSGSIKLLQSSPITNGQIILGKFLAMVGYCFLLVLVLFLFVLVGGFSIHSFDWGMVWPGLFGSFLLTCTYSAIGLFMSSLTSYQVVAAISTLAVLASLNYIGAIWQGLAFVRTLTYFLNMRGQNASFIFGLLSTEHIFYYLITMAMFLFLTIMRLDDKRTMRTGIVKFGRYTLLTLVFLVLGYITSRPSMIAYFDTTANKSQTISANSQEIIKKIKEPLVITAYTNLLAEHSDMGLPEFRNLDYIWWEPYLRFNTDIKLKYEYYYDTSTAYGVFTSQENAGLTVPQVAQKFADAAGYDMSMFKTPAEMRKQINLAPEEFRFVRLLEFGKKKTFLRIFDEPFAEPFEHEIMAAIGRLVETPPQILFVEGQFERSINRQGPQQIGVVANAVQVRSSMINQGFDVDTIYLQNKNIPKDISILVIADPRKNFTSDELGKINEYINAGGNLLIMGEPGRQSFLNPLLSPLGVELTNGTLVSPTDHYGPDHLTVNLADDASQFFDREKFLKVPGEDSLKKIILQGACGLAYKPDGDFKIKPLVMTDPATTWNKVGAFSSDTSKATYNPEQGDNHNAIPVALALTREKAGKQQRIIVMGDCDFMANYNFLEEGNMPLVNESFRWLNYGAFPIETTRPKTKDNLMRATKDDIPTINFITIWLIPGILFIYSLILLIKRRRK